MDLFRKIAYDSHIVRPWHWSSHTTDTLIDDDQSTDHYYLNGTQNYSHIFCLLSSFCKFMAAIYNFDFVLWFFLLRSLKIKIYIRLMDRCECVDKSWYFMQSINQFLFEMCFFFFFFFLCQLFLLLWNAMKQREEMKIKMSIK